MYRIFSHFTFVYQVMEKSNFQILNDAEVELAQAGQYLVNMPIAVDKTKVVLNHNLDSGFLLTIATSQGLYFVGASVYAWLGQARGTRFSRLYVVSWRKWSFCRFYLLNGMWWWLGVLQLDKKLLTTFFKENKVDEVPSYADQVLRSCLQINVLKTQIFGWAAVNSKNELRGVSSIFWPWSLTCFIVLCS